MTKSAAVSSEDAGKGPACGKRSDEKTDESDAGQRYEDVQRPDDYGIVIYYKVPWHTDDSHILLYETKAYTYKQTYYSPKKHYHPALVKEDTADEPGSGPQILKRGDIVPLLYDEHGQGAEDIARDHYDDKEQYHEDDSLLYAHHAVDSLVLHVLVLD